MSDRVSGVRLVGHYGNGKTMSMRASVVTVRGARLEFEGSCIAREPGTVQAVSLVMGHKAVRLDVDPGHSFGAGDTVTLIVPLEIDVLVAG